MVLGHGGNTTVIKTTPTWQQDSQRFAGCWHNWFSGILNEPGPGSVPFDLDPHSYANTIIGHQNCFHGGVTHDTSFTMLEAGKLQLGNFNSTDAHRRAGGDGPWSPQQVQDRPVLQVEGVGFIKHVAAEQVTCSVASGGDSSSSPKELCAVIAQQSAALEAQSARIERLEAVLTKAGLIDA